MQARNYKFEIYDVTKPFFTATLEKNLAASDIAELGGIIKIGRVATDIPTQIVKEAFLQRIKQARTQLEMNLSSSNIAEEMLSCKQQKSVFGVSVYNTERSLFPLSRNMQRFLGNSLKHDLSNYGRKSKFLGFPKRRPTPQLTHVEVLKKELVEKKAEILFCIGKTRTYVSTTMAVHNPFEYQKRDVGRPFQRKIFAMPPRLARIMINQTFCTRGKTLLDPFCGVGTILQEALLAGAKVTGLDLNPWCVDAARKNLEWLVKEYKLEKAEYNVLLGDSRKLTESIQQEMDCIATEPDLGPPLRHVPTVSHAMKIIEKQEPLYHDFLTKAYEILRTGGRLALVAPYIRTRSEKPATMRIEEKATDIGFKKVYPFRQNVFSQHIILPEDLSKMDSFLDMEERHKIGREIHIFQK